MIPWIWEPMQPQTHWYLLTRLYSITFHIPLCSLFHIIYNHNITHRKSSNTTFLYLPHAPATPFVWLMEKRMCKHQKGVFSPFCSENVQCITTWLYKEWSWHFSLQVWTMTGKFIEQQVCFTWHHTARWNGGNSWVIIFMPFARVRVLAICCVMSWIGCARVIGHPI